MLKYVFLLFVSLPAFSECPPPAAKKPDCKPKPKSVPAQVIVKKDEAKAHQIDQNQKQEASAESVSTATTGNQSVNITFGHPEYVYGKRPKASVMAKSTNPNRLQFLLGLSETRVTGKYDDCEVKIKKSHEFDGGVQYLRDFSGLTASGMITLRKNVYFGFGFNW